MNSEKKRVERKQTIKTSVSDRIRPERRQYVYPFPHFTMAYFRNPEPYDRRFHQQEHLPSIVTFSGNWNLYNYEEELWDFGEAEESVPRSVTLYLCILHLEPLDE